jgi:hypothetical protein
MNRQCCRNLRPVYTVGYPMEHPMGDLMVLIKFHAKSAIYTQSPTDFLWHKLSTMGYPMGCPMKHPTV